MNIYKFIRNDDYSFTAKTENYYFFKHLKSSLFNHVFSLGFKAV